MVCKKCGEVLESDLRFCIKCGARLSKKGGILIIAGIITAVPGFLLAAKFGFPQLLLIAAFLIVAGIIRRKK